MKVAMKNLRLASFAKRKLRRTFGWCRLSELRNKVLLAHTAIANRRFEGAEVARLAALLPLVPEAKVAVITATYSRPDLLVRSVTSALAQTLDDLVVVVVDDGGGLPALPADPRLTTVSLARNTNVLGLVLNVGIRLSRSQYVAFLDDDNEWRPDHLQHAVAALEGKREIEVERTSRRPGVPDVVYTALDRRLPDGTSIGVLSVPFDRKAFADGRPTVDTNALVARRMRALHFSRIRRARGVYPREDWELAWRLSRRHHIGHVPEATVRYLVNPRSYYTDWKAAQPASPGPPVA
jgi:glycosyltransferase involved in cell wall biosynthesis